MSTTPAEKPVSPSRLMRGVICITARPKPVMHPSIEQNDQGVDSLVLGRAEDVIRYHTLTTYPKRAHRTLTRLQENALFVAMNLCYVRAGMGQDTRLARPEEADVWLVMSRRFESIIVATYAGIAHKHAWHLGKGDTGRAEAMIALMRAVWSFDAQRAARFSTYAKWVLINNGAEIRRVERKRVRAIDGARAQGGQSAGVQSQVWANEDAEAMIRQARVVRLILDDPDGHKSIGVDARVLEAMRLRVDRGLRMWEVGKMLGVTHSTASKMVSRAAKRLADHLHSMGVAGKGRAT